jgi:hypothetical protein
MFSLLAESRFRSWQEKFKEIEAAADRLYTFGSGHLSFAVCANRALDGATAEACSIIKNDLFGADAGEDAFDFVYGRSANNPIAHYLREFAQKTNVPAVIDVTHLNSLAPR